ncbi:type II toxin-antitoxin system HicA family toxin [Pedobacter cryophilus]|uniref:Addiction module toxin, HicA family n=1 Tax=Pedobacter cryophilus TaxID=2571271 RepID=A0A4U1C9R0_9SPHI|nr:type II toxin-antitoxin system HicA family toxin [Pedobacter cryophilus]TKC00398.1 addiction module toxin, HicA family [Pedobacter cryophilus]
MSKIEKLITRFLNKPKDLTWDELVVILGYYGYLEIATGKTGGSRRKFSDKDQSIISLHKPHPKPIVKSYVIEQVLDHLKEKGKIK